MTNTSQECIKQLVEQMEALIEADENVSIMMVATIMTPNEKNNTYNYNFYMHGNVDDIEEALINRVTENVLEEDGTIYSLLKTVIGESDTLITEGLEGVDKPMVH